jgi:hypothetical protein
VARARWSFAEPVHELAEGRTSLSTTRALPMFRAIG